ncbi:MAG TPA: hypothetical protein VMF57_09860, partial [Solirubrobacteraceae bacterium]|nr:hypothetical protein [Solirubrobacteraceae bacterium]
MPDAEAAASVWQPLHPAEVNSAAAAAGLIAALAPEELVLEELGAGVLLEEDDEEPYPGMTLYPGTSAWTTFGGTMPTGGGALAGWARSQARKAVSVTTCALERI